ncbi:MAG: hypothetical protein RLZZ217_1596 [Planctomycetota bacterium]
MPVVVPVTRNASGGRTPGSHCSQGMNRPLRSFSCVPFRVLNQAAPASQSAMSGISVHPLFAVAGFDRCDQCVKNGRPLLSYARIGSVERSQRVSPKPGLPHGLPS